MPSISDLYLTFAAIRAKDWCAGQKVLSLPLRQSLLSTKMGWFTVSASTNRTPPSAKKQPVFRQSLRLSFAR
jgi:hypothetical protein